MSLRVCFTGNITIRGKPKKKPLQWRTAVSTVPVRYVRVTKAALTPASGGSGSTANVYCPSMLDIVNRLRRVSAFILAVERDCMCAFDRKTKKIGVLYFVVKAQITTTISDCKYINTIPVFMFYSFPARVHVGFS